MFKEPSTINSAVRVSLRLRSRYYSFLEVNMFEEIELKYFMVNCKYIGKTLRYEDYLLEILNNSQFFRSKSKDFSEYAAPVSESNSEADACASEYQIDFKLLVHQEVMQIMRKNAPTVDRQYMKQGIIIVNDPSSPTLVPDKNVLLDIMNISHMEIDEMSFANNTMSSFVKNLGIDKHLFFYYPNEYVGEGIFSTGAYGRMLSHIFTTPFQYREEKRPDRDTYVCVKVNDNFLIYEWREQKLVFVDSVNELLCPTYLNYKLFSFY